MASAPQTLAFSRGSITLCQSKLGAENYSTSPIRSVLGGCGSVVADPSPSVDKEDVRIS